VAILALFEAERRGYDVGLTVRLALIHDLEEAITGDLTPRDKRELTAKKVLYRREIARSRIVKMLPVGRRREYREMWRDLTLGGTREARLVKDLDKLEMAFQAKYYEVAGVQRKEVARFYRSAFRGISDTSLRKVAADVARSRIRRR
jgi:5'-deoxynucleotidase